MRWGRSIRLIVAAFFAFAAAGLPAAAEKRVALVIGNNAYRNLPERDQLRNAVNDARAVKATLEGLGFKVIPGENLDRAKIVERLSDFEAQLQEGDVAFFFYSGHGVSLNGANYMLPSDIVPPRSSGRDEEERLADLAVAETRVIDRIKRSGARVAVMVLDACRDNPLTPAGGKGVGGARGLSPAPETRDMLTIYSAGVGQQARDRLTEDDREPNSVFTRVFLKKLMKPGLGLRAAAFETQGEVAALAASAGHEQVPGVYSQIIGEDLYLAGREVRPPPAVVTPISDEQQAELEAAMQANGVVGLDEFLTKYPKGPLANIARLERDKRLKSVAVLPPAQQPSSPDEASSVQAREAAAWAEAKAKNSREAIKKFIRQFPGGAHRGEANAALASLEQPPPEEPKEPITIAPAPAQPEARRPVHRKEIRHARPSQVAQEAPEPQPKRSKPSGKCFTFNGERFCQ